MSNLQLISRGWIHHRLREDCSWNLIAIFNNQADVIFKEIDAFASESAILSDKCGFANVGSHTASTVYVSADYITWQLILV